MDQALLRLVWSRAGARCEYCLMPAALSQFPLEIDHVYARSHGGLTESENLALACFHCNHFKGTNLAGIDPISGRIAVLFHPRRQNWGRHFRYDAPTLVARTTHARATIATLHINAPDRVARRHALIVEDVFPTR